MPNKIKAILFDMDGVIVDSELYWEQIEKDFAKKYKLVYSADYRRKIMAVSPPELADIFIKKYKIKEKKETIIKERNATALSMYRHECRLLPGFLSLVKRLRQEKLKIALVSSSPFSWINTVIKKFDLKNFFDLIISAEEMTDGRGKPHPAIYLFSARKLGVKPAECLVFEDSVNGVKAAKAAGMSCVAVPDRRWVKDRRGIKIADLIAKSLKDKKIYKLFK